jgi:hypothetical protein
MNEKVVRELLKTEEVQDKLDSIVRKWAYKCDSGKPEYTREGFRKLREAIEEENVDVNPDFRRLEEISIFKDKYTSSEWFQPRPAGNGKKSEFMNDIEAKGLLEPEGLLLRLEDPPTGEDLITVDATTGGDPKGSIYLKDRGGNQYEVQYSSRSALGSMFLQASEDPNTINWKASTYETAACAGLAMANARKDPETVLSNVEQAESISEAEAEVEYIIDVLEDSQYDWDNEGRSEVVEKLSDDPIIDDVAEFVALAWGTWNFWSNELSGDISTPYFVHGSIKDYYSAEKENENIRTEGSKANTADFIIVSEGDIGSFIEKMRTDPADFEDGVSFFVDDENVRWVQVSHKKRIDPGGAQLGKIKTAFGNVFGIEDKDDFLFRSVEVATDTLEESFFGDALDKAQSAVQKTVNMVSGGYEEFKNKVNGALSSVVDRVRNSVSIVANYFTQDTSDVEQAAEETLSRMVSAGALRENKNLREDVLSGFRQSEISAAIAKAWNSLSGRKREEALQRLYGPMNQWLGNINQTVDQNSAYSTWDQPFASEFEPAMDKVDKAIVNRIFATYQGLSAFNKVIQNESGSVRDAEDVLERFIELQKEMYFGRTELPVWKVGQEEYKPVGSGETFREERVQFLEGSNPSDIPLVLFKIKPQKSGTYGTLLMAIAEDFDEEGQEFLYTQIKFRSKGGYFDFTVEGTKSGVSLSEMK